MNIQSFILQTGLVTSYILIFLIVFAESGLFFGFFLPGDSLMIGLGIIASQGHLNIFTLILVGAIAAIAGDTVGYLFGKKVGPALFDKEDSLFFKKSYVHRANDFYNEYGTKTIVLARFTPFIRTFAPIVAGIANMKYQLFLTYNIIGAITWVLVVTLSGYFLGNIPGITRYATALEVIIVVASLYAAYIHLRPRKSKKIKNNDL